MENVTGFLVVYGKTKTDKASHSEALQQQQHYDILYMGTIPESGELSHCVPGWGHVL